MDRSKEEKVWKHGRTGRGFHTSHLAYHVPRIIIFIFLALFSHAVAEAASKYAGDFLTLGVGARPLSLGGSFVAIADDSTAAYWNPAGLGRLSHSEVAFMHSSLGDLDSYDFVNYIHPVGKNASFGLSWLRVGVDDIPITSVRFRTQPVGPANRPKIDGTFSNTDNAFLLSYGRRIGGDPLNLFVGGNAKFIYISALRNTNAIGIGGDIGALWMTNPERSNRLSVGVVAQDFFKTKLYWNTPPENPGDASNTDTIEPNLKIGLSYAQDIASLNSRVLLTVDTDSLYSFEMHYGAEYVLADLLSLRIGVQERKGVDTIRQMTAGAGLRLSFLTGAAFSVDYAFLSNDELGNSNRISLMTRF
ncbi:MAG: PorV/PorQ family protein [Candidatus Poribacteria bacterium]|nr:PorV/PorQ family protein [Candidatus Poribacteria bacterium]